LFDRDDLTHARPALEEPLATFRELEDLVNIADGLLPLADVERRSGNLELAGPHFGESLRLADQLGDTPLIANSIEGLGGVAWGTQRLEHGVQLFTAAAAIRARIDVPRVQPEAAQYDLDLATARRSLGPKAYADNWAAGQLLSQDRAIDLALKALAESY